MRCLLERGESDGTLGVLVSIMGMFDSTLSALFFVFNLLSCIEYTLVPSRIWVSFSYLHDCIVTVPCIPCSDTVALWEKNDLSCISTTFCFRYEEHLTPS